MGDYVWGETQRMRPTKISTKLKVKNLIDHRAIVFFYYIKYVLPGCQIYISGVDMLSHSFISELPHGEGAF